jgi:hypothetical protein
MHTAFRVATASQTSFGRVPKLGVLYEERRKGLM